MSFLKNMLSALTALIIFSGLVLVVVVGIVGVISSEEPVTLESNSILHLKLNRQVGELEKQSPLEGIFPAIAENIGLKELKEAILNAKEDDKIKGIFLETPFMMSGIAIIEEIRDALIEFKDSGKFVISYSEFYTEGAYYLASVSDKVYIHPEGELELNGLAANVTFFKGMLDKLEVEPQVFRVGDFKSAVEPFLRTDMSPENRLQLESILNSINDHVLSNIAESRGMELEQVKNISNKMLIRNAQDAKRVNIIDDTYYLDQVYNELKQLTGLEKEDELEIINYDKYKKTFSSYVNSKNVVAVIVASGDIISGKGDDNTVGSDKFAKEIRKARENDKVKAIVMRINSPGGSFIASDVMWREIKLAAQEKPVIASMSDVAASGGYYLAMACDTILAQPNTITGSIGIFSVIFNAQGFLNNKLGITTEEVATGEISTLYTMSKPLSEEQQRIIQKNTDEGYETFISKAAEGRRMSPDAIKVIASGRVWTGEQALNNGLVDILGGIDDAITLAAEKSGVNEDYKVKYYPRQKPFIEQLLSDLEGETKTRMMQEQLGQFYPYLKQYDKIKNLQGLQSRLPFDMTIQ
ncbi:signal peptide peptidase SppA [Fulvivirga sp. M361]|uniref:signal peptide peptidase SppA n=1 Tax=Fulvivirga sp. M361 TaxID=2594266 RepID=UPI001179E402|nr:signal peptide peptidase SppA [Fulvivirga sp. M361]TRX49211.1 signal peptide peptidase SppA [Fulvivirga sp. M361]